MECPYSVDRIPDAAIGLDSLTLKLMRWAMGSWERVSFLNNYMAGHLIPRIELDLIPALRCAGHFILLRNEEPKEIDDNVEAGRAIQRFWLTATKLGLQLQPEMTPLDFHPLRVSKGSHCLRCCLPWSEPRIWLSCWIV